MSVVFVSPMFGSMIQPAQVTRNGLVVTPGAERAMRDDANKIIAYRTKELFSHVGQVAAIRPGTSGSTDRWRFRSHTGPYAVRLHVHVLMAPDSNGGVHPVSDARATFQALDTTGTLIGSALTFHYGGQSSTTTETPNEWQEFYDVVTVPADTDIQGLFTDVERGRLVSACVYEESATPDTANGYFPPVSAGANIYGADRQNLATFTHNMWTRGGAQLLNFTADDQTVPRTIAVNTSTNLVDGTTTTVTAASPGVRLDLTGHNTLSQATVPVVLWVYGKDTTNANGRLDVRNSAGVSVLSVSSFSTVAGWLTATGTLPTAADKYDLTFQTAVGTLSIGAVSIYELT